MLAAVLGGVLMHQQASRQTRDAVDATRAAVETIDQTLRVRAATGEAVINGRGWPVTVDPEWFGPNPPSSRIVSGDRPWLEVAPPEHAALRHPPIRVAIDRSLAAFWYNPGNGVVRARAPVAVSDRRSLEIYRKVNGEGVDTIVSRPSQSGSEADFAPGDGENSENISAAEQPDIPDVDYDYEEYGDLDPTKPRSSDDAPAGGPDDGASGAQR